MNEKGSVNTNNIKDNKITPSAPKANTFENLGEIEFLEKILLITTY